MIAVSGFWNKAQRGLRVWFAVGSGGLWCFIITGDYAFTHSLQLKKRGLFIYDKLFIGFL